MDYMFPSRTNDNLCLTSNNSDNLSSQEDQDPPHVFLQFPSPFLDDMDTSNLHHHHLSSTTTATDHVHVVATTTTTTQMNNPLQFNTTTSTSTNTSNTERLASKLKCSSTVRKKRSAGKKDRHSKIHTAQGLRDRRMRLSVHTARKFFDLNDMLGFDKASKTIEWLFSKSKKAIDEVTTDQTTTLLQLQPDDDDHAVIIRGENNNEINESPSLSACCETDSPAEKDENLELQVVDDEDDDDDDHQQIIEVENYSKPMEISYPMVTELSGKEARATSELIQRSILENNNNNNNHVEKLKRLFEGDPRINFQQSHELSGFLEHHHQHNMELDQSSSGSGSYPLEFSNAYHFLKHLHLDNSTDHHHHVRSSNTNYLGNINTTTTAIPLPAFIPPSSSSIYHDYNKSVSVITTEPPAGWLNSKNTFLGFLGGWDNSENNSRSSNNGLIHVPPLINGISRENTAIISTNYRNNFHSQNQSGQ